MMVHRHELAAKLTKLTLNTWKRGYNRNPEYWGTQQDLTVQGLLYPDQILKGMQGFKLVGWLALQKCLLDYNFNFMF